MIQRTLQYVVSVLQECQSLGILVTGPQRSGTTIAAHILAEELDRPYADESDINVEDLGLAREKLATCYVLQAPAICYACHTFRVPVVMVHRPLDEIHASEVKAWWGHRPDELAKYGLPRDHPEPSAVVKYRTWEKWQRAECLIGLDLDYHSLESHPLFIPAERRQDWTLRQWREDT